MHTAFDHKKMFVAQSVSASQLGIGVVESIEQGLVSLANWLHVFGADARFLFGEISIEIVDIQFVNL